VERSSNGPILGIIPEYSLRYWRQTG